MMTTHNSFWLDRMAGSLRRWPLWLTTGIVVLLFLLPFAIAYADGSLSTVRTDSTWRLLLLPTVMILYALLIAPVFSSLDEQIVAGIRPLSTLEPAQFDAVVAAATRPSSRREWFAFGLGMLSQLALYGVQRSYSPLELYMFLAFLLMFGTLGWIVYKAVDGTQLGRALARRPMKIDIFDVTPFEPIGRQSLLLAMVFVGGATISLFFVFSREDIFQWRNVAIYTSLILIAILVFFLNMWPIHRLLAQARKRHVRRAGRAIADAYEELSHLADAGENTASVESTINAWTTMEARLKVTQTWPYNTEMLRTLVVTVLTPIVFGISRLIGAYLAGMRQ